MSLISNTGTLTIAASSTTPLATAVAGMTAGQWLNFGAASGTTGLNLLQSGTTGASGIRTPFCSEFVYDDVNKLFYVHSADHNQDANWFRYNEASNSLVLDHTASWMVVNNNGIHGYDHVVNAKGKFYSRKLDEEFLRRWDGPGLTTWTSSSTIAGPGGNISAAGHCYHAGLNRILVHQLGSSPNGIIVGLDPDSFTSGGTGNWTSYSQSLLNPGDPHNFNAYNPISQLAWFGGGNGSLNSWLMGNSGVPTANGAIPNLPDSTGPNNAGGLVLPNPHNGNFTVWYDANNVYDFSATSNRTFTKRTQQATGFVTNMASQQGDINERLMAGVIGCSIPAPYNVFFFWKAWTRNVSGEMWIHAPQAIYPTSFPFVQNPLSESSSWTNGKATGIQWSNVQSTGSLACGTQTPAPTGNFDDSIAVLAGFGPNQSAQATLFRGGGWTGALECELLLRFSITNGVARGYEIDYYQDRVFVVSWNGARGDFTIVNTGGTTINSVNGDLMYAEMNGSTVTVKKNGATVFTQNLQTWAAANGKTYWSTGNPGVGFYVDTALGTPGANTQAGWQNFLANSL